MFKNHSDRYATAVIALHWLTLILIVLAYVFINLHNQALKGSEFRAQMKHWHFVFGMSVLPVMLLRLIVKSMAGKQPAITPEPPTWNLWGAQGIHLLLYVLLIALPVLGWLKLSADGKAIPFDLPPLMGVDKPLAKDFKTYHKFLGNLSYYLIGFHAAATLVHHYLLRDTTFVRMLPRRKK